ncbi:MAG: T9SS C-terminal target domain-containing protein, partial [Bacteroidota bacterium]
MKFKFFAVIAAFILMPFVMKAAEITVNDASINPGEVVTWTNDNVYILNGFVFVEDGAVLNIQAGTVIKGKHGEAESASALIVARGGKIYAEGTADNPIIFTHIDDDPYDLTDSPLDASGQWGGVIILGKASVNTTGGVAQIEGIPSSEPRGEFGGGENPNDDDNSGVFRYVSIRHGGTNIGANNEINGLTMGGVGRGTTIDHVEVWYNDDDGFEWFGGTVNCSHLVSAFNADDSFDHDFGYTGKNKFLFSIQNDAGGNHGAECSSNAENADAEPVAMPMFSNATFIGAGVGSGNSKSEAFDFKDATGGTWRNNIFMDFSGSKPVNIEDKESGTDARGRLEAGELSVQNNIWWGFEAGNSYEAIAPGQDYAQQYLANSANKNMVEDPMLNSISRMPDQMLDPRPIPGSPALTTEWMAMGDDYFDEEAPNFLGAFGANNLWIKGWTMIDAAGYIYEGSQGTDIQVYDTDIKPGDDIRWTSNNTYHLNGFIFVEDGAILRIDPGTVIKGKPGEAQDASALIVARGGKIYAEGTA